MCAVCSEDELQRLTHDLPSLLPQPLPFTPTPTPYSGVRGKWSVLAFGPGWLQQLECLPHTSVRTRVCIPRIHQLED